MAHLHLWSGSLQRVPADVALPQRLVGRGAAVEPEQPLGDQQVGDDGDVDDERDDFERRHVVGELVDLDRQQ